MLAEEDAFIPNGWSTPFFTKAAYQNYLKNDECIHNERIRPKEQDFFDWLLEHKDILDVGADGMTMAETLRTLK